MARKIILVDDIDGTESDDIQNVAFSFGGKNYTTDLSAKNLEKFEKAVAPFIENAVQAVGTLPHAAARVTKAGNPERTARIKSWGAENGYEIPARGRIKGSIIEAYEAATGDRA